VNEISTPCRSVCNLDPQGHYCQTCRRSIDEIARWGSMSEVERKAIMAVLPDRRLDVHTD